MPNSEQRTSFQNKEISGNQTTRTSHTGYPVITTGTTSTTINRTATYNNLKGIDNNLKKQGKGVPTKILKKYAPRN